MSFWNCVDEVMRDDPAVKDRGERAQAMWKDLSDQYERQGHPRHKAEVIAAEDVKEAFKREAGEVRHVYLSRIANMRKLQQDVLSTKKLTTHATKAMERVDYMQRGLLRRFNGTLAAFLRDHHTNLVGTVKNKAQMMDVVRELHGEATGSTNAKVLADGIRASLDEMRLSFNEYGGIIGKLDDWGMPHSHNALQIRKAGFDTWFADVQNRLDWTKIEDHLTGKPFQADGGAPPPVDVQRRVLKEVHDNIVFGRGSAEAVYGKSQGSALYRARAEHRILHFKSADDWMAYNKSYGSGDPYRSLMTHVGKMARDVAAMHEFGPNPALGLDYMNQLITKAARDAGDTKKALLAQGNTAWASRMMRVYNGGSPPAGPIAAHVASFMAGTRQVLTAALVDRAMLVSISDLNTTRMAAEAIRLNPKNIMSTYVGTLSDAVKQGTMATDDLMRLGWIMDTLSDPGAAAARFDGEFVPNEVTNRILNFSMRIQGLAQHTDTMRFAMQADFWGTMAKFSDQPLADIPSPFGDVLRDSGLTDADWREFTSILQTAPNGATFANPLYWRAETNLPRKQADDIFFKVQTAIEEWTEKGVPTSSLLGQGAMEPAAYGLTPGSPGYEAMKSTLMFKSFITTLTINQARMVQMSGGLWSKGGWRYIVEFVGGATALGAISLQLYELSKGNDPLDMTDPEFWGRAAFKGGGFGIIGDLVSAGQTSWGGGFSSYLAGPIPQLGQDAWDLSVKNGVQFLSGDETKFAEELARFGKRYTPAGQTPLAGPAIDLMLWDQLQLILDPESYATMMQKAQSRENLSGNGSWWMPGSPLPSRAPDLSAVAGP